MAFCSLRKLVRLHLEITKSLSFYVPKTGSPWSCIWPKRSYQNSWWWCWQTKVNDCRTGQQMNESLYNVPLGPFIIFRAPGSHTSPRGTSIAWTPSFIYGPNGPLASSLDGPDHIALSLCALVNQNSSKFSLHITGLQK